MLFKLDTIIITICNRKGGNAPARRLSLEFGGGRPVIKTDRQIEIDTSSSVRPRQKKKKTKKTENQ